MYIYIYVIGIGATIRIGQESWCLPYAGFFFNQVCSKVCNNNKTYKESKKVHKVKRILVLLFGIFFISQKSSVQTVSESRESIARLTYKERMDVGWMDVGRMDGWTKDGQTKDGRRRTNGQCMMINIEESK